MTLALRSGKDVFDMAWQAAARLDELAAEDGGYLAAGKYDSFDRDAERFLSTSIGEAQEEFDRIGTVARSLHPDESTDLHDAFKMLNSRLGVDHWDGDGAEAFRRQLSAMEVFYKTRSKRLAAALQGLGAVIAVETATRDSYYRLCYAIEERCSMSLNDDTGHVSFVINAIGEGAKAVLDADPISLLKKGAGELVNLAVDGVTRELPQAESDGIIEAYRAARDDIIDQHQAACQAIDGSLSATLEEIGKIDRELIEPSRPIPDVTGPDFRWEKFAAPDVAVPPAMEQRVEQERKEYAKEHKEPGGEWKPRKDGTGFQPNAIQERLNGR